MIIWQKIAGIIDRINENTGRTVSWLTGALVLLVVADVVVRYAFSSTAAWIMELEWHFFSLIFLLGAGYAFRHDRHVRVDLWYARFSARDQALVNIIGNLTLLFPWLALLIYTSWQYAYAAWLIGEGSPDPGGLPARYLIKFAAPLGLFLLGLQGVAHTIRQWAVYRSGGPQPDDPHDTPPLSDAPR